MGGFRGGKRSRPAPALSFSRRDRLLVNKESVNWLKVIAAILTVGYLRYRERRRRELSLDSAESSSPYGHEVNGTEKGE